MAGEMVCPVCVKHFRRPEIEATSCRSPRQLLERWPEVNFEDICEYINAQSGRGPSHGQLGAALQAGRVPTGPPNY